jgi:hypothetical protein
VDDERREEMRGRLRGMAALREAVPGHFTLLPPRMPEGGEGLTFSPPRSAKGALFVLVVLALFSWPIPLIVSMLAEGPGGDGLFGLVFGVFFGGFLVAWSIPVGAILLVLLAMLAGRERLIVAPGRLYLRIELLGPGIGWWTDLDRLASPRWVDPPKGSGTSWRGGHVAFDVDGRESHFGCRLTRAEAERLIARVDAVLGRAAPARGAQAMPLKASRFAAAPAAAPEPEATDAAASIRPTRVGADPEDDDRISLFFLLVANLVPLAGVLFLDWTVGDVMLVYWAESAIIGVFNLAKMLKIGGWLGLPMGVFFCVHYGAFMAGHLLFLYGFFMQDLAESLDPSLAEVLGDFVYLWPALVALLISHGVSFVRHFLGRAEYRRATLKKQMHAPYGRIMIMHVTIIFGGFLTMALQDPTPALVLLVALKVAADVRAHRRSHRDTDTDTDDAADPASATPN